MSLKTADPQNSKIFNPLVLPRMPLGLKNSFSILFVVLMADTALPHMIPFGFFRAVAPPGCSAGTTSNCNYGADAHGAGSGTCASGYSGTCSYGCSAGVRSLISNSCVLAAPTVIESFETTGEGAEPTGWTKAGTITPSVRTTSFAGLPSAGSKYVMLQASSGGSIAKNIDLTGYSQLRFDFAAPKGGPCQVSAGSKVYIGATEVYSSTAEVPTSTTVNIDISGFTGVQELRLQCSNCPFLPPNVCGAPSPSFGALFYDNIRLIP